MITVSEEFDQALANPNLAYAIFVEWEGAKFTTYHEDITIGDTTYLNSGVIFDIGSLRFGKGTNLGDIEFSLQTATSDNNVAGLFVYNERVTISIGIINPMINQAYTDLLPIYSGYMSSYRQSYGENTSGRIISLKSEWVRFDAKRRDNTSASVFSPDNSDTFFSVARENRRQLNWGL